MLQREEACVRSGWVPGDEDPDLRNPTRVVAGSPKAAPLYPLIGKILRFLIETGRQEIPQVT